MADMKRRYEELYNNMASSKDVTKMIIFGNAEKWVFGELMVHNPRLAERWLEKLEASCWDNYLTKAEAEEIVGTLINQDGRKGGKWTYAQFEAAVNSLNAKMECAPHFNSYALWATADMLYSDHAESLSEFIDEKDMPKAIYKLAIEKLKDVDRPRFIRKYFDV